MSKINKQQLIDECLNIERKFNNQLKIEIYTTNIGDFILSIYCQFDIDRINLDKELNIFDKNIMIKKFSYHYPLLFENNLNVFFNEEEIKLLIDLKQQNNVIYLKEIDDINILNKLNNIIDVFSKNFEKTEKYEMVVIIDSNKIRVN